MKYSEKIKEAAKSYFDLLDKEDFSHGFSHVERVTRLALKIAEAEGADLEVVEAAALLHDIGRADEQKENIKDHAEHGAHLARTILNEMGFSEEKIESVCHCILVHRCKPETPAETLEAKVLQDADRLDALGAVDVARVIGSSFQTSKYARPVYIDEPYIEDIHNNKPAISAVHYLIKKVKLPKRKPENFNTKTGRKIAEGRYKFSVEYIDRFIKEWRGEL